MDSDSGRVMPDGIREPVQKIVNQAQETAGTLTHQLRQQLGERVEGQRHILVDGLDHLGEAVDQAARSLRDRGQPTLAGYVDSASSLLRNSADYLETHALPDLAGDLSQAVKQRPLFVLGGFFALGFMAARFLKSTPVDASIPVRSAPTMPQTPHGLE